jgi:hypothetical protein
MSADMFSLSSGVRDTALLRLEQAHARGRVDELRTLAPGRSRPTPLVELGRQCLATETSPDVVAAFAEGLGLIAEGHARHFPDNLFGDFDFIASSLLAEAPSNGRERAEHVLAKAGLIVHLLGCYGCESPVQFRYVHDFTYGYDWVKWVNKLPAERAGVGPFDLAFLTYMVRRGNELHELIAHDDTKYPPLPDGQYRNPFPFKREPEYEIPLLIDLARDQLIPLEAWRVDAQPTWQLPFAELRIARATSLGIPPNVLDSPATPDKREGS